MVETGGIRAAIELTKFRLTGFIALSAMFGHILAAAYTGENLYIADLVWKWSPNGNTRQQQLTLSGEWRPLVCRPHRCLVQNRGGCADGGWWHQVWFFPVWRFLPGD